MTSAPHVMLHRTIPVGGMSDSDEESRKRDEIRRRACRTFTPDERRLIAHPPWPDDPEAERRAELIDQYDDRVGVQLQEHMVAPATLFDSPRDADAPRPDRPRRELIALIAQVDECCTRLEQAGREHVTEQQFHSLCDRLVFERIVCFARSADRGGARITLEEVDAALTAIRGRC